MSNARQKVDRFTQQLFDPEVERPEHDQVLLAVQQPNVLADLLTQLHGLPPLEPFRDDMVIALSPIYDKHGMTIERGRKATFAEAVQLAGRRPEWESLSPIRIERRQIEVLMNYTTSGSGAHRLMGFIDIAAQYRVMGLPMIDREESGKALWTAVGEKYSAFIEVKSAWPTAGALMRQLNLYRSCWNDHYEGPRGNIVVGPDDSVQDVVHEHGYRLVTFNETLTEFRVVPRASVASKPREVL